MITKPTAYVDDDPILFVDDDALCSLDTCSALRDLGYNVLCAHTAEGALDALGQDRPLTALVTDIDLGDGPDGFEVARVARRTYPNLAVVFISGLFVLGLAAGILIRLARGMQVAGSSPNFWVQPAALKLELSLLSVVETLSLIGVWFLLVRFRQFGSSLIHQLRRLEQLLAAAVHLEHFVENEI